MPLALWLSGFRANIQNILAYIACELSIFQGQIPISLKSLANTWLSSGSLDLDTVKKKQPKTDQSNPKIPQQKHLVLQNYWKGQICCSQLNLWPEGCCTLPPAVWPILEFNRVLSILTFFGLSFSYSNQTGHRGEYGGREGVQLPPHWRCKATPSASETLKSEYIKFYKKDVYRAVFPLSSFRLTYFLPPALRLFPVSLLRVAAVVAAEAAAALSASSQREGIQHGLGETTIAAPEKQFLPKSAAVAPAEMGEFCPSHDCFTLLGHSPVPTPSLSCLAINSPQLS